MSTTVNDIFFFFFSSFDFEFIYFLSIQDNGTVKEADCYGWKHLVWCFVLRKGECCFHIVAELVVKLLIMLIKQSPALMFRLEENDRDLTSMISTLFLRNLTYELSRITLYIDLSTWTWELWCQKCWTTWCLFGSLSCKEMKKFQWFSPNWAEDILSSYRISFGHVLY